MVVHSAHRLHMPSLLPAVPSSGHSTVAASAVSCCSAVLSTPVLVPSGSFVPRFLLSTTPGSVASVAVPLRWCGVWACSERSPLGSFAQLAHSPRIQPADGHYHSTNYLQRERAKRDGAEQEGQLSGHAHRFSCERQSGAGAGAPQCCGEQMEMRFERLNVSTGDSSRQRLVDGDSAAPTVHHTTYALTRTCLSPPHTCHSSSVSAFSPRPPSRTTAGTG